MYFELYAHRNGNHAVPAAERLGVENLLDKVPCPFGKLIPKEVTDPIKEGLVHLGWTGKTAIGPGTNISVTGIHGEVGIAIQFGNVSRVYADLLKLQALYMDEKISSGLLVVPHRDLIAKLSKTGGTDNRCSFERVVRELPVFSKVVTMPILVFGVYSNKEGGFDEGN